MTRLITAPLALTALALLAACGGSDGDDTPAPLPRLAAATPGTLQTCAELPSRLSFAQTTLTAATSVPAGTLTVAGRPVGAHCRVTGTMNPRTGVNGEYAIGFEVRLPVDWNGRFYYQANGGSDGSVVTATGPTGGGGVLGNALMMGFAVLSSDAGHNAAQNGVGPGHFGLDPQARLDYGYQAVGTLTPMARALVRTAYGRTPDRMYIGGCSNGGRHAMVAASRYAEQYDGILAGDPGFNLPKAAVAEMWDTQQFARVATANLPSGQPDISTGFTVPERNLVAGRIVARCDALDGATDGMVLDVKACQSTFSLANDVPTCTGARDGTCLTASQKSAIGNVFAGARNAAGQPLYASFPYDPGLAGSNWAFWKYTLNTTLGASAVPYIFVTPPVQLTTNELLPYALAFSMETDAPKIFARSGAFTQSSMEFMTPPDATDLSALKNRGAKMIVYHGTADPVFSSDDTAAWYEGLRARHGGQTTQFTRYFEVPQMTHCSGGPATDQFDMIGPLVDWVEKGVAPERVVATARGAGNAGGVNTEVPATWAPDRSRPLCPYPQTARYAGSGSLERAESFVCR